MFCTRNGGVFTQAESKFPSGCNPEVFCTICSWETGKSVTDANRSWNISDLFSKNDLFSITTDWECQVFLMWVFIPKFCFFLQVRDHATAGNGVVSTLKWCVLLFSVVFCFVTLAKGRLSVSGWMGIGARWGLGVRRWTRLRGRVWITNKASGGSQSWRLLPSRPSSPAGICSVLSLILADSRLQGL